MAKLVILEVDVERHALDAIAQVSPVVSHDCFADKLLLNQQSFLSFGKSRIPLVDLVDDIKGALGLDDLNSRIHLQEQSILK